MHKLDFSRRRVACAAALLLATAPAALAQQAEVPPAPAPTPPPPAAAATATATATTEADEAMITVVGTRIRGLDLTGAVQAIQLDRQTLIDTGSPTIIEALQDLPQTAGGRGTFSTATAGALSSDTPVGASAVSLRGLGVSSTLTLINSRRASVSAFANGQESFIDVSAIPSAAVERVEVLPNGASALYGADAVAGVINIILREDFEGLEVSGSYGDSTAVSNEDKVNTNLVFGTKLGDHHVMVVADYFRRNPFFLRDRKISRQAIRPSEQGFFPSFNDLFLLTLDQTEEPQDGGCSADDFGSGDLGEFCRVNNNAFVSASDRLETASGLVTHRWEASDRLEIFNEFIYSWSNSRGTSSPANFSRAPVDPENPSWPQALIDDIVEEGGADDFDEFFGFPIYAWGKIPEPRSVEVTSKSFRLVSGFEYNLSDSWFLEGAFTYGGNDRTQRGRTGLVRSLEFYDLNLGNRCTDGTRVERWDVDPARPDADFVGDTCEDIGKTTLWYNPFGGQAEQAEGIRELISTTAERRGRSRAYGIDLTASGDLLEWRGRTIKGAFGAEWRREKLTDTPAGEAVATDFNPEPILGFSSTTVDERRDQYAFYGELYVPVFDNLDLQLAGRYDHYSSFGGDFNPKVSARWQPLDFMTLRGSWSTSFRAPSLAQSGAGVLLSSYRVRCSETPEACGGNPLATGRSLLSEDVGNPDLEAEQARSYSFGAVIEPSSAFNLRVDYWNIRHENLVGIDEDDFIRRAIAGEFPVVAQGALATGVAGLEARNIVRNPDGSIASAIVTDAHFELSNLGFQTTSGIDFAATYAPGDLGFGKLSFTLDATYLLKFERQSSVGAPVEELAGDYLYPRFNGTARVSWTSGRWHASLRGNYTSGYRDDPDTRTLEAVGLPPGTEVRVDDYATFDLSLSYDYAKNSFVQLAVDNLFNAEPPLVLGSSTNVDLFNHDLIGRFISVRVTHRFW